MTPDQAAVCLVLDRYMSSSLLKDRQAEIVRDHGPEVYALARKIIHEAINAPVDWSKIDMNGALNAMAAMLSMRYPWLTPEARSSLAFGFTVTWK